ncbi:hypothetical protein HU200_031537 [Digitaria exilis]|uniref:Uncharacterized protein n=1 Tax=Digitaria exilis TaxID=1010633 RepID=A0A835BV50_9POAL|nr:hypothetical protein HU200_031537 [Digitaria exilis]
MSVTSHSSTHVSCSCSAAWVSGSVPTFTSVTRSCSRPSRRLPFGLMDAVYATAVDHRGRGGGAIAPATGWSWRHHGSTGSGHWSGPGWLRALYVFVMVEQQSEAPVASDPRMFTAVAEDY